MIRALALLLALAATEASALSCRVADAGAAFDRASASPSRYAVVNGRAEFDRTLLPHFRYKDPATEAPPSTAIPARVHGQALDTNGFLTPFDRTVTLDVSCLGPWCGTLAPGEPYLMFLELRGDTYALALGPCGDFAFADPKPETLDRIARCFQLGGTCASR